MVTGERTTAGEAEPARSSCGLLISGADSDELSVAPGKTILGVARRLPRVHQLHLRADHRERRRDGLVRSGRDRARVRRILRVHDSDHRYDHESAEDRAVAGSLTKSV